MRIIVSTTQRCGSTWITQVLKKITGLAGEYFDGRALGFRLCSPSQESAIASLDRFTTARGHIGIFKTHDISSADFDSICNALPQFFVVTVTREFKDVVISRYFYYRYYWETNPKLGTMAPHLSDFFDSVRHLGDREAIARLVSTATVPNWADEWAAFQGASASKRVLRLAYEGLLTGHDWFKLAQAINRPLFGVPAFAHLQREEERTTGRHGRQQFFRSGRSGEWREWLSLEDGRRLDLIRDQALSRAKTGFKLTSEASCKT